MAAHHLLEAEPQHGHVEPAAHPHGAEDVVGGEPRQPLVDEPQALLAERGLERSPALRVRDARHRRRRRQAAAVEQRHLQDLREAGDGRLLEQGAHRQVDAERLPHPGHHLGRQERLAAGGEEVVVDAEPGALEHLGPDPGERLLDRVARCHMICPRHESRGAGDRQDAAVELAVRGERHLRMPDEDGGDHGFGQAVQQERAGLALQSRGIGVRIGGQMGDQDLPLGPGEHRRLADAGHLPERRLDLAQLDAEPAHLHLMVDPSQELDAAVGPPAGAVAGAVDIRSRRLIGERIGHENESGACRVMEIAAANPGSADTQLAGHADRYRAHLGVDHGQPRVAQRPADRRPGRPGSRRPRQRLMADPVGALGRAIGIEQRHPRIELQPLSPQRGRQRLAGRDQPAQAGELRPFRAEPPRLLQHQAQHRGHDLQHRDPRRLDRLE